MPDGQLILRESAQCPPEDESAFQDINRHRYFNTNNLWISLPDLAQLMEAKNNNLVGGVRGVLPLLLLSSLAKS